MPLSLLDVVAFKFQLQPAVVGLATAGRQRPVYQQTAFVDDSIEGIHRSQTEGFHRRQTALCSNRIAMSH